MNLQVPVYLVPIIFCSSDFIISIYKNSSSQSLPHSSVIIYKLSFINDRSSNDLFFVIEYFDIFQHVTGRFECLPDLLSRLQKAFVCVKVFLRL